MRNPYFTQFISKDFSPFPLKVGNKWFWGTYYILVSAQFSSSQHLHPFKYQGYFTFTEEGYKTKEEALKAKWGSTVRRIFYEGDS